MQFTPVVKPPWVPSSTILAITVISCDEPCIEEPKSLVAPGLQNAWLVMDWTLLEGWRNGLPGPTSDEGHVLPLGLRTCPLGMECEPRLWLAILKLSILERREIRGDVIPDTSEPRLACRLCMREPDWPLAGCVFRRGVEGDLGVAGGCMLLARALACCCSCCSDFWWSIFNWSCISRTWTTKNHCGHAIFQCLGETRKNKTTYRHFKRQRLVKESEENLERLYSQDMTCFVFWNIMRHGIKLNAKTCQS